MTEQLSPLQSLVCIILVLDSNGVSCFPKVGLAGTQIWWSTEVGIAFARLEEGYENAIKDYFKKQVLPCCFVFKHPVPYNRLVRLR